MTKILREGRYSEEEVKDILKLLLKKYDYVIYKCVNENGIVYALGESAGILGSNLKIMENLSIDYFIDNLDVYGLDDKEVYLFKQLKLDGLKAAKVFTGVLEHTNKATILALKCLDGTFTYASLMQDGAVTLLEKFITSIKFEDLRALFTRIKSCGWDTGVMSNAFAVYLKKNAEAFKVNHKERDLILSQLKVLYPKHLKQFNEALGLVEKTTNVNIFEEQKDLIVIYMNPLLIAQCFPIPFVDATAQAGYFKVMSNFIKHVNDEDLIFLEIGAKSINLQAGLGETKGKWILNIRTTGSFNVELFQKCFTEYFEKAVELSSKELEPGRVNGVNSDDLILELNGLSKIDFEKEAIEKVSVDNN